MCKRTPILTVDSKRLFSLISIFPVKALKSVPENPPWVSESVGAISIWTGNAPSRSISAESIIDSMGSRRYAGFWRRMGLEEGVLGDFVLVGGGGEV